MKQKILQAIGYSAVLAFMAALAAGLATLVVFMYWGLYMLGAGWAVWVAVAIVVLTAGWKLAQRSHKYDER